MRRTAASLVVAALVMLAGCAGGIAGPNGAQTADSGDSGTVSFYVSDEENAIGQFEHLNVTVTKVGFAQSADADANASGSWNVETDSEGGLEVALVGNVTAGENATVRVTQEGEAELEVEFGESDDSDGEEFEDESESEASAELGAVLEGSLAPGENVTVVVTDGEGEAVKDATVAVDGEVVGETNAEGELAFAVPEDVSLDTEVTVTSDGETITLDATTAAAAN